MKVSVPIVNAFIANGKGGNPAGVVLDAAGLSDARMQDIAYKVGAAETAFILPSKTATHRFRFFTPKVEVPLCGHATVASWSLMHAQGVHPAGSYTQDTLAGLIHISIEENGMIFMEQPEQEFGNFIDFEVISKAIGIPGSIFNKTLKSQIVRGNLMVGLKSKEHLNSLRLYSKQIIGFGQKHGFGTLHMFALLDGNEAIAAVRNFDPKDGIDEDIATGTTNGSFLTYLKHYGALSDLPFYKIEQGEALGKLSHIYGKFSNGRVWIGGKAATADTLNL